MPITLVVDPRLLVRWHLAVAAALEEATGERVRYSFVQASQPIAGLDLLYRLEALIDRRHAGQPTERLPDEDVAALPRDGADPGLVIDLVGTAEAPRRLTLACNGLPVDVGAPAAVLADVVPVLELDLHEPGRVRPLGRWPIAVEHRPFTLRGVANVYGRALQLLVRAASDLVRGHMPDVPAGAEPKLVAPLDPVGRFAAPTRVLSRLAERVAGRIRRHLGRAPRWHVGLRPAVETKGLPDLARAPFHRLRDGGRCFFADPFLWSRHGRTHLFVEEFPFATGRGVISTVEIGPDGSLGTPYPVLERPYHLSYPFVLEAGGEIYMVPETAERRAVELWRATSFPDRWEPAAVLVEGADLADASLFEENGRWFLLASSRERWTSSWDGLDVWTAPHILGPWRRVGPGPARIDVRTARPAGRPFRVGGRLIRPVQDSAGGYGHGLAFMEVDGIDETGIREHVVARVRPRRMGVHTYDRAGGFEVVDAFGVPRGEHVVVDGADAH